MRESNNTEKRKHEMLYLYNKLMGSRKADESRNEGERASALDFYTHDALPSISYMQDAFKAEQR